LSNVQGYRKEDVVDFYLRSQYLFAAEQIIFDELKAKLPSMKMLDIGVGGGRTTSYFGPIAKEYLGIDYSLDMINGCRLKFDANKFKNLNFQQSCGSNLSFAPDNSYDFILFSFNGIDYNDFKTRAEILCEIYRVLKPGGMFLFSTHNLYSLDQIFTFKFTLNPFKFIYRYLKTLILYILNGDPCRLMKKDYAIINDGAHNFGLRAFYGRPSIELTRLAQLGFKNIRIFAHNGFEIHNHSDVDKFTDPWLHFFCLK